MSDSTVIYAADRFPAPAWTPEQIRRTFAPSVCALPFITMAESNKPVSYWNDVPTEKSTVDFQRGRKYAEMTIEAIGS